MTVGQFLDLQAHEFDAHLVFDDGGLDPYYALNSVVRVNYDGWKDDGKPTRTMTFGSDTWSLAADYDQQPVDPWDHTSYEMDTVPMFRIYFVARDELYDGERADQSSRVRGGTMTIRPRWPHMTRDGGRPIKGVPNLGGPYLDVQIQASNIDPTRYHELLKTAMAAFDVSPRYFETPHEISNIADLAVYARGDRDAFAPLFAADGPIARTHAVLEAGQSGFRSHKEDHRKLPGYHVNTMVDDERTKDIIPGTRLGKEIKHYYPLYPDDRDPSDPLYYPKFEVSYQTSLTDETLYYHELEDALRELETTLYNYLDWAGIPIRADPDVFESDAYFNGSAESRRSVKLVDCPLPKIADEQESVVMSLWGDTRDSDRDLIESLVADGGKPSRAQLADRTGYSYRTVRRFVQRCESVVRDAYDGLSVESKHMEQMLVDRVRAAEQNFRESVEHAVVNAADAAQGRQRSKWSKTKQRYNVNVQKGELRDTLRVRYIATDSEDATDVIQSIRMAAREKFASLRGVMLSINIAGGSSKTIQNLEAWRPGAKIESTMSKPSWYAEAQEMAQERCGKSFSDLYQHQKDEIYAEVTG